MMIGKRKRKRVFAVAVLTIIFIILMSPLCMANSAEPPSIIIVVPNAPPDLSISIFLGSEELEARVEKKFMETQFSFYNYEYLSGDSYSLNLTYGNVKEVFDVGPLSETYMNIYELDYKRLTLKKETSGFRVWLYTAVRILLTLVIEAAVFFAFGFRSKRAWLVFIIINLLTQGILNVWLNTFSPSNGYLLLVLIIGELFVFLAEIIGFLVFIKEHKKFRTFFYVILANILSLILGGYLITFLPI